MQGRKGHRMGENTPSILLATFVLAPILHLTSSCPYRTHRAGFGLIPIASVDSLHLFWFNREFASLTTGYLQPFSAWSKPSQPSRKKHNTLTEISLSTTRQKLRDQPPSWYSSVRAGMVPGNRSTVLVSRRWGLSNTHSGPGFRLFCPADC